MDKIKLVRLIKETAKEAEKNRQILGTKKKKKSEIVINPELDTIVQNR